MYDSRNRYLPMGQREMWQLGVMDREGLCLCGKDNIRFFWPGSLSHEHAYAVTQCIH